MNLLVWVLQMQTVDNGHIKPKVSVDTVLHNEFWNSNTANVVNDLYMDGKTHSDGQLVNKIDH